MIRHITSSQSMKEFNQINSIYIKKLKTVSLKLRQDCIVDPLGDDVDDVIKMGSWHQIHDTLAVLYDRLDDDQEHMLMLVLNPKIDIIGFKVVSSGAQHFSLVDIKIIFRNALLLGATKIVLTHNHTSGLIEPSKEDIEFTQRVIKAGSTLSIPVVDHLIFTQRDLVSMRMEDHCSFETSA